MKTVVQWEYDFRKWSENMIERSQSRCKSNMGLNSFVWNRRAFNEALEILKEK